MTELSIPYPIWEPLQQAFLQEGKRLCKQVATVLDLPEREVLQTMMPKLTKMPMKLVTNTNYDTTCCILLKGKTILERCRQPCVMGSSFCIHHQLQVMPPEIPDTVKKLTRMARFDTTDKPLWCDESTWEVFTADGTCIGEYDSGSNTIYKFVYEKTEE